MSLSKSEQREQKDLNQLRPKKPIVAAKDLSKAKWNDELFNREKSYRTDKGYYKVVKADWRKLHINGVEILAIKGEKLSKSEFEVFKTLQKDVRSKYIVEAKATNKPIEVKTEVEATE